MRHERPSVGGRVVILDANLAILLCVGHDNPIHIASHKRLSTLSTEDFFLLRDTLSECRSILLTPNTATETSNLLRKSKQKRTIGWDAYVDLVGICGEEYLPSSVALSDDVAERLGLTDTVLLHMLAADRRRCLLTVDMDLYLAAGYRELDAFNFNHWRDL